MSSQEGVIKFQCEFTYKPDMSYDTVELNAWRTVLYRQQLIGRNLSRYGGYGYGNISMCVEREAFRNKRSFVITGTQTSGLASLQSNHYCLVREFYPKNNKVIAEGPIEPSSESMTHGAIYNHGRHMQFIFHVHSPEIWRYAKQMGILSTRESVKYGTPEMAEEVERLFEETSVATKQIFRMGGHEDGIISFGKTSGEAGDVLISHLVDALILAQK